MKNHDGTTDFLKLFSVLVFVAVAVWWIESRYGSNYVMIVFALLAGTLFFIGGSILTAYIQKNTLNGIAEFSSKDAQVDRYRMQSLKELSRNDGYRVKTEELMKLIDYKQNQKLLAKPVETEDSTFWESNETVDLDDWS